MPKPDWQSEAVPVDGARLAFELAGEGQTVVFVHAGICDRRMWELQFARYAERYRVIRYDMRGFGDSSNGAGPYSHASDLVALLDELGIDSAILVGASMGGGVALDVALSHPGRIIGLVTVGTSHRGFTADDSALINAWQEAETAFERGDLVGANGIEMRIRVDGPHRTPDQVDPALRRWPR